MKNFRNLLIVFTIAAVLFSSCSSDDGGKVKSGLSTSDTIENNTDDISYQIPSPEALFSLVKGLKLPFRENLLNPVSGKYESVKSRELNLGVYVADLSYCSVFNMNENTLKYFTAVYKLSESLGISSVVGNAFLDRIKENISNPDSLSFISNSSYFSIIQDLESSGKGKTVAMVTAGGWIEGMFIVASLVDNYEKSKAVVSKIADQKIVFDNLYKNLAKFQTDNSVAEVQKELEVLKSIFDQLDSKNGGTTAKKAENGKIVIGSSSKPNFSEQQFNDFKLKIKDIRTKITQ